MQNRFKFRVWNKKTKKMYDVDSLHLDSKDGLWVWTHYYNPIYDKDLKIQVEKNFEIMQSTGLKDKNGTLIYEGDVVDKTKVDWKYEEYTRRYVVCWDRTQWQLGFLKYQRPKAQNNRRYDRKIPFKDIVSFDDYTPIKEFAECEVIGNIYENADLLESEVQEWI